MALHSNHLPASHHRGVVLLTGAQGFTGPYLCAELRKAGYRVISTVTGVAANADEIILDITSLDNCCQVMERVQPDYLIHLAGVSFIQHSDAQAFYHVNVIGTENLLQALAAAHITPRSLLLASSAQIYGNSDGVLSESHPAQPVNHYAISKLAMEYIVKTWSDRFPIVITRPFNYTGVGQSPHFLVPKIVSHFVQAARLIELGRLDIERDLLDVRTVAKIYLSLMEQADAGSIVNICSGTPLSIKNILRMMQEIAGYEIQVQVNPRFVRAHEIKVLVGSPAKMLALVGNANIPSVPFMETLRWMYETAKKNMPGQGCNSNATSAQNTH